jgi:hypothetical protein
MVKWQTPGQRSKATMQVKRKKKLIQLCCFSPTACIHVCISQSTKKKKKKKEREKGEGRCRTCWTCISKRKPANDTVTWNVPEVEQSKQRSTAHHTTPHRTTPHHNMQGQRARAGPNADFEAIAGIAGPERASKSGGHAGFDCQPRGSTKLRCHVLSIRVVAVVLAGGGDSYMIRNLTKARNKKEKNRTELMLVL